jgi:polyribonucleotide nucleotidyltransferase
VSIGSKDGAAVEEARRRIELILDPPTAEVGVVYEGRVVNITKFGAFVNILPGRDGLVHISKLGRGKRIDRVEDVLSLGDEVTVRVDDIDQNGKLSLSMVGEDGEELPPLGGDGDGRGEAGGNGERRTRESSRGDTASFEAFWDDQARAEFGDLGPGEEPAPAPAGGRDRGGDRRGGRGGRGGRGRGGGPRR